MCKVCLWMLCPCMLCLHIRWATLAERNARSVSPNLLLHHAASSSRHAPAVHATPRAAHVTPQAEAVQSAVMAVDAAARELWPHSRVALFGSQVRLAA